VRAAQACLVAACAAQLLVPHRGRDVGWTIALHLAATLAYLRLALAVVRGPWRPAAAEAFGLAAVLALLALGLAPQLSDDVWRYLFEGRVVAAGHNPYRLAPAAPELAHLRDATWVRIPNKEVPAVYPAAVQWVLAASVSVLPGPLGVKIAFGACAMLAFAALWRLLASTGLPPARAVVFGWCPLLWLECAGEGHTDSLAVLFTVVALWASIAARPGLAGAALGLATAAKLLPCVLLPFVARRGARAVTGFLVALGLVYLPFFGEPPALVAATVEYAARWRANDSAYALLHGLTELLMAPFRAGEGYGGPFAGMEVQRVAKVPLFALGVALLWRCWRRAESPERTAFLFFAFFVACTPTMHPWYVVLLLPWLCFEPRPGLLLFTGTVALAYHVLPGWLAAGVWKENAWLKAGEYLPFYVGLLCRR
jgi:hypothetical protein